MHRWYYMGLGDALKELSDHLAYKEYCELVNEVFGLH
jgi:hypothetical protein